MEASTNLPAYGLEIYQVLRCDTCTALPGDIAWHVAVRIAYTGLKESWYDGNQGDLARLLE